MTRIPTTNRPSRLRRRTDAEGELIDAPTGLRYVWIVLLALTVLEALDELGWIGGPAGLYRLWFHDTVLAAATLLIVGRAWFEPTARLAWLAFGAAMGVWCVGSLAWSAVYGGQSHPPYPTFADVLWLLWYPLIVAGIVLLIRVRFQLFELHRWMDGVAVVLIVLVAGFALVVQPITEETHLGWLATIVDFSYPVLDLLLIGAILGVYGLLGWKPDAMWVLIGFGILAMTSADAAFAVQEARGVVQSGHYDFVWTVGALLLAAAAWVHTPTAERDHLRVTGMRAVALALVAQALAIGIQIYAYFEEVGRSERIVTAIVLGVASVQIILARPRTDPAARDDSDPDADGPHPTADPIPEPKGPRH